MFFIIAIIAFIVAVISLIVYIVQMNRTRKQYLGKDAVNEIAKRAAEKARRKETVLTCDYCGCKIDTTQHKVCPHCGASYGADKEWLRRHEVDPVSMEKNLKSGIEKNKKTVTRLNADRMKKAKFLIVCITAAIVFVAAIVTLALTSKTQKLNHSDDIPSDYELTNYQFVDPVLVDNDSIKVELGGIYFRDDSYANLTRFDYNVEVKIINKSGKKGKLEFDLAAANSSCTYASLYEDLGTDGELIRLLRIPSYSFGESVLKTMSIEHLRFRDDNYDLIYQEPGIITVETTADFTPEVKTPKGDVLFEKNGLVFSTYRDPEDEEARYLQITNTGTYNFEVGTYASMVNDQVDKLWIDYCIPAGCQAETDIANRVYLDENEVLETVKIQLECKCPEYPEQNFVTEYIEIPVK